MGLSLSDDRLREDKVKDPDRLYFFTVAFAFGVVFDTAFRTALAFTCAFLICRFFLTTAFVDFFLAGDLTLTPALIFFFDFVLDLTAMTHILNMNSRRPPPQWNGKTAAATQPFSTLTTRRTIKRALFQNLPG